MKKYNVNGNVYSFEIISEELTRVGMIYLGRCLENGKEAWLDSSDVQFLDGSKRLSAYEIHSSSCSFALWGGVPVPRYNYQKTPINSRY